MARAFGIDISKWQSSHDLKRKMDFDAVKRHQEEVTFIAARAGMSFNYVDPTFNYYWKEMKRIKVERIAYHVLYFATDATSQMDNLFEILKGKADWNHDRIALDLEVNDISQRDKMTETTRQCVELCKARTGRYPIAYSRAAWVNQYLIINKLPALDWWLAHYQKPNRAPYYTLEHPGPPPLPNGVNTYLIHQTAEKAKSIGGTSYYMDYNRWNGDKSVMARYFGRAVNVSQTPNPEPVKPDLRNERPAQGLFQAQCMVSTLNTYIEPSSTSPVIGKLRLGDVVTVFEEHQGWYKLHPRDAIWCQGKAHLLRRLDHRASKEAVLFQSRVIVPALYKRGGPGKEHRVTGNLIRDELVNVYEEHQGWLRIAPDAGIWVNGGSQYLQRL